VKALARGMLVSVAFLNAQAHSYEPAINYMLHCMGCHGPSGSGERGHVPSVRASLAVLAGTAAGRRYLVEVPGSSESTLSNKQLAAVLNWMIDNFTSDWRKSSLAPFTTSEVARYRATPLVQVSAERARLLGEQVPQIGGSHASRSPGSGGRAVPNSGK
jgi:hypothetical protein